MDDEKQSMVLPIKSLAVTKMQPMNNNVHVVL
jgi:hypothetical protein